MAEKRIDMRVVCPFYLSSYGRVIRCAPVNAAQCVSLPFRDVEERNDYIDDFCASRCWQSCVVAQMCLKKFEEENGG